MRTESLGSGWSWKSLALPLALMAGAGPAAAQDEGAAPPVNRLEIAAFEKTAEERSPAIVAARSRLDAAVALVRGAGAPDDPSLDLWVRNAALPGADGAERDLRPPGLEVEVVQPVRFPGKREAREAAAAAEVDVAAASLALVRSAEIARLRSAFAELASADREQRTLAEAHELLEVLAATARARFGASEGGSLPVFEAELAQDEHDQRLDRVLERFLAARSLVAEIAGVESRSVPLLIGALPPVEFGVAEGALPVAAAAPAIALAKVRVALAERRLEVARLDLKPDFGVGGGVFWPEGESLALTAKVGMDLPFFRRRRLGPRVAAAEAELAAARAELGGAEITAREEGARLGAERDRVERSLARLTGAIVPHTSAALDAARIAFLNGNLPFSRLLELQNEWFHARIELADSEAERYAVWAKWQALAVPVETAPASSDSATPAEARP